MKKYYWMMAAGIVATLSLVVNIWIKDYAWTIIINIIAMVGSGILCSAIVSYIIEVSENKRIEKMKCEQRDYILSSVKYSLLSLFSSEYKNLSEYITLNDTTNKYKTTCDEIDIKNVIDKLCDLTNQIMNNAAVCYQFSTVIDSSFLARIKRRNELAFQLLLPYYEKLNKDLLKIYEDSNIYFIDGIFDKEQLDKIHSIQIDVDSIIGCANESNIDLLFEYKDMFFADIKDVLGIFNIEQSQKIKCFYKSIVK